MIKALLIWLAILFGIVITILITLCIAWLTIYLFEKICDYFDY